MTSQVIAWRLSLPPGLLDSVRHAEVLEISNIPAATLSRESKPQIQLPTPGFFPYDRPTRQLLGTCSMPKACTERGSEEDVYSVARGWRSIQRQALLTNLRTLIGETTLSPQTKAKQIKLRKSDNIQPHKPLVAKKFHWQNLVVLIYLFILVSQQKTKPSSLRDM